MRKEMLGTRDRLNKILAKHTGQSVEKIKQDTDRDNFMDGHGGGGVRADRQGAGEARSLIPVPSMPSAEPVLAARRRHQQMSKW